MRSKVSEELITPEEAASYLKMTIWSVYQYIKAGKIKAVKLGRSYRIREDNLLALLEIKDKKGIKNLLENCIMLGELYFEKGERLNDKRYLELAKGEFKRATKIDPFNVYAHYKLFDLYSLLGDTKRAKASLKNLEKARGKHVKDLSEKLFFRKLKEGVGKVRKEPEEEITEIVNKHRMRKYKNENRS